MRLSSVIQKNSIMTGLKGAGRSKHEILSEITDYLLENTHLGKEGLGHKQIVEHFMQREGEFSTGIGEGFALPHARISGLKNFYLSLAISKEGVDYESLDHKPVHFFIVSLVSSNDVSLILQYRAAIMRFFALPDIKKSLLELDAPEIWKMIDSSRITVGRNIVARDIMLPQVGCLTPSMTLNEAAREMHRFHADTLPVVDDEKRLLGDLSCHDLFSFGLPNFFGSLKKLSIVKHMNPFEKYFKFDDSINVGSLIGKRETFTIDPSATLMEIIYEMTMNNKPVLYVVDEGKLVGVIDRFAIIDKILIN